MRGVGFRGWVHILASGHAMIGGLVASHTHTLLRKFHGINSENMGATSKTPLFISGWCFGTFFMTFHILGIILPTD